MLMTEHNLWFYQRLMQAIREGIAGARLGELASAFLRRYRGAVISRR
jgi:queuine tRNA-ribosyltransferase